MEQTGLQPILKFYWNTATLIIYKLSMIALELQWQTGVVKNCVVRSLKYLQLGSFQKKFGDLCSRAQKKENHCNTDFHHVILFFK